MKLERRKSESILHESPEVLRGIGPKLSLKLREHGLTDIEGILRHIPFRYKRIVFLDEKNAKAGVEGRISCEVKRTRTLGHVPYRSSAVEAILNTKLGLMKAVWFQQFYMNRLLQPGRRLLLQGTLRESEQSGIAFEMVHPEYAITEGGKEAEWGNEVIPCYSLPDGITDKKFRKFVRNAFDHYERHLIDYVPGGILMENQMPDIRTSLKALHFPGPDIDLEKYNTGKSPYHRRLNFGDLFLLHLSTAFLRKKIKQETRGSSKSSNFLRYNSFVESLPFDLTGAQRSVIEDILQDLKSPHQMMRLLQGDVGSGKTIAAAFAILTVIDAGQQCAMMAPTETLADQHYRTLKALLHKFGIIPELLKGAISRKKRKEINEKLESGECKLIVGTQALIQNSVAFRNLGLVVVDEQHRFGVLQRLKLKHKGPAPDFLVMTATPIPRTLGLSLFGHLDISVLDELPPGRKPVLTEIIFKSQIKKIYAELDSVVEKGRQAFWATPLLESENQNNEIASAKRRFEDLQKRYGAEKVRLLHGKMKSDEKEEIILGFEKGEFNILTATTVIEVGIDIPEAVYIVIENAERFGLSQTHQLRGRVGRSWNRQAFCRLLMDDDCPDKGLARVKVLAETNDGFRIAEEDLRFRGPGDFLGLKQAGAAAGWMKNLVENPDLAVTARRAAEQMVFQEKISETRLSPHLRSKLIAFRKKRLVYLYSG